MVLKAQGRREGRGPGWGENGEVGGSPEGREMFHEKPGSRYRNEKVVFCSLKDSSWKIVGRCVQGCEGKSRLHKFRVKT